MAAVGSVRAPSPAASHAADPEARLPRWAEEWERAPRGTPVTGLPSSGQGRTDSRQQLGHRDGPSAQDTAQRPPRAAREQAEAALC